MLKLVRTRWIYPVAAVAVGATAIGSHLARPAVEDHVQPAAAAVTPSTAVSDAVATEVATPAAPSKADAVVDAAGAIKPAAYRAMAAQLATAKGIEYRFGTEQGVPVADTAGRSRAWKPADKALDVHGNGPARTYQVAGPQTAALNDFSSNQGQLAYVPGKGGSSLGVDHVATLEMGENTFAYQPRLTWTYYGAGHPELEFTKGKDGYRCVQGLGTRFGRTVAQARAYAHGEAMASSFVAFDNGVIATAGHNTAQAGQCIKLPGGLRPSAISVTNGNEFVLVTAWDPKTISSKLVVIAVGGARKAGEFWNYEWTELYPGMSNYGHPTFLKVLGSVDLPMAAPTSLSAVSNEVFGEHLTAADGVANFQRGDFALSKEDNRQTFRRGGVNRDLLPTAGYAVVASKSEHKVSFVDLQPLFNRITDAYFGSRSRFDSIRSNIGKGADQWPYAFSKDASAKPRVVKTITTAQAPTSVAAALTGAKNQRAYVGTMNGRLRVYRVAGLATAAGATSAGVKLTGMIAVGKNPTNITYSKDKSHDGSQSLPDTLDNTLIVTSRADKKVQWVKLSKDGGSIRRTLADGRLVDPIAAEDNNNHGTESYVLSVADYGAGRLFNFRYGPVNLHTNGGRSYGMGPSGKSAFEFGGAYNPRGRPFSISVTNVT